MECEITIAYIRSPKMRYLSVNLTKHIIELYKANMIDEKSKDYLKQQRTDTCITESLCCTPETAHH